MTESKCVSDGVGREKEDGWGQNLVGVNRVLINAKQLSLVSFFCNMQRFEICTSIVVSRAKRTRGI